MSRIKTPFISGTILNNPLAIGDTTLSSAALANLAAVASPDIAAIILDPAGSAGNPEVVWVTAHTASATTATISRGQEGSTARQHLLAVAWAHGPTIMDFNQKKGTDIASASSLTMPNTDEDYFHVTGTTTVTAIGARAAGKIVVLEFTGACPITYNGTSLILLGGVSYTTTAGDILVFVSEDSGNWRQVSGPPAQTVSTQTLITRVGLNTAEQTTTSTSAIDLVTISGLSIPVTSGLIINGVARKGTGAAAGCGLGLKVNSTVVCEAVVAVGSHVVWETTTTNQLEDGTFQMWIFPRSANYLQSGYGFYFNANVSAAVPQGIWPTRNAVFPNVTITSIVIRGISGSASVVLGVKEVAIFEVKYV